ncbi:MAG: hypothetical protein GX653_04980 [Clostridiales bacterium]|nr:hypothetical protein [Clostridiales bacterium]
MKPSLYEARVHTWGRVSLVLAILMFMSYPLLASFLFGAAPDAGLVFQGLLAVAPVFWVVGAIEAFTFGPMLGSGGAYLGFVTGNLTAMKVPAALRAMQVLGVKPNTPEGEAVSTIAIAASSIVTTLVLLLGMLLLNTLRPVLESDTLAPAFKNVLPALFGGLAVVFVAKNWKIAVAPVVLMLAVFLIQPRLSGAISLLIPVGALVAILAARWLYKSGRL